MRPMVVVLPLGRMRTESPGAMRPLAICPAKPRKSRFGRLTHWTGRRKDFVSSALAPTSTASRCSISAGPLYHGVFGDAPVILSPLNSDIGMEVKVVTPNLLGKDR